MKAQAKEGMARRGLSLPCHSHPLAVAARTLVWAVLCLSRKPSGTVGMGVAHESRGSGESSGTESLREGTMPSPPNKSPKHHTKYDLI